MTGTDLWHGSSAPAVRGIGTEQETSPRARDRGRHDADGADPAISRQGNVAPSAVQS